MSRTGLIRIRTSGPAGVNHIVQRIMGYEYVSGIAATSSPAIFVEITTKSHDTADLIEAVFQFFKVMDVSGIFDIHPNDRDNSGIRFNGQIYGSIESQSKFSIVFKPYSRNNEMLQTKIFFPLSFSELTANGSQYGLISLRQFYSSDFIGKVWPDDDFSRESIHKVLTWVESRMNDTIHF